MKFLAVTRQGVPLASFWDFSSALDLWKRTGAHHVTTEHGEHMTRAWSAPNEHVPDRADVDPIAILECA